LSFDCVIEHDSSIFVE